MKKSGKLLFAVLAFAGLLVGCQTPSDRDAGKWESNINIAVNGSSNVVSVAIDGAGNTLASASRDEEHKATQTTDTKPVTSLAWGAGASDIGGAVKAAKSLFTGESKTNAPDAVAAPDCKDCKLSP